MLQLHYITFIKLTIACDVGCEKLGLDCTLGCSVVEEKDGTVIDEDEILMEKTTEVLMILMSGETWMPPFATLSQSASAATDESISGCPSSGDLQTMTQTLDDTVVSASEGETVSLDQLKCKSGKDGE